MLVLRPYSKDKKYSKDKINIGNPKANRGAPTGGQPHLSRLYGHDDVIKWKHFPCYWPFVREFTGPWWIPHTKAWGWWFGTPSCPLWRHGNELHLDPQYNIFHWGGLPYWGFQCYDWFIRFGCHNAERPIMFSYSHMPLCIVTTKPF